MRTSLLKPGLLVHLRSKVAGGVEYDRTNLTDERDEDGSETLRWETTKRTEDPEEHAAAIRLRGKICQRIKAACANTSFALLCPFSQEERLDRAIREGMEAIEAFNKEAKYTSVAIYCLKARIADDDEQAMRGIADELRTLLGDMERGVQNVSRTEIKAAIDRAQQVAKMLDRDQATRVTDAIKAARAAARAIATRIEKKGEDAATVLRELDTKPIETARFAFLDTDVPDPVDPNDFEDTVEGQMPLITRQRFADLEPDDEPDCGPIPEQPQSARWIFETETEDDDEVPVTTPNRPTRLIEVDENGEETTPDVV